MSNWRDQFTAAARTHESQDDYFYTRQFKTYQEEEPEIETTMKIKTKQVIELSEWDALVQATYNRPYKFQQQEGCKSRGTFTFTVPDEAEDYERDAVPEVVNGPEEGVSFAAWLKRDPKAPLSEHEECRTDQWAIDLWWYRNFYPSVQMIANDLHAKGLLPAGEHTIEIDW